MSQDRIEHRLKVSEKHELQIYEVGPKGGIPIVFLHGGPGAGIVESHFLLFDLSRHRVILFDQRGCGKSTPQFCLEENTTWDLVEDIEKIRNYFKIPSWTVVGGSWGSTLGYAYLGAYPDSVNGAFLWGSTEFTKQEIYEMSRVFPLFFPDQWALYIAKGSHQNHEKIIEFEFHELLSGDSSRVKSALDRTAALWRNGQALTENTLQFDDATKKSIFLSFFHYAVNFGFFNETNLPSRRSYDLKNKKITILHGRQDMRCFASTAYKMHQVIPGSILKIIPGAGHGIMDPVMFAALKNGIQEIV
jgi:proline iminopeptidase